MKTRRRLGVLAIIFSILGATLAVNAGAADPAVVDATPHVGSKQLQISKIDASDPNAVSVRFTWNGDVSKLTSLTMRQNGTQVETSNPDLLDGAKLQRAYMLVISQSGSMVDNGGVEASVTKVKQMIAGAPANARFGIVTFGTQSVLLQPMTADKNLLNKALDSIKPDPKSQNAMWDAVIDGVSELNSLPDYEHNLILVTDGTDKSSTATAKQAQGAVIGNGQGQGATVFALGISQGGNLDETGLSKLVEAGGGRFFITPKARDIGGAFEEVTSALGNEYQTTFKALPKSQGAANLQMTIAGVTANANFTIGGVAQGATGLSSNVAPPPSGPAFLRSTTGLILAALLIALAVGIVGFIVIQMVTSRQSALEAALNPYTEGYAGGIEADEEASGMSQNALLQRALAMTEEFAERQGFLESVEIKLEMAEVPLKASEAILVWTGGMALAAIIGFVLGGIVIAVVFLLLGMLAGPAILNLKAAMRRRRFQSQLPDMLTLLAGALRAGFSLMQAVDAVSQEIQNPMGKELRRVVSESRLGRELEDALDDTAERTGSADFAWAVMAIRIQREVGGNLAELLLTVADTMIQRERLRREVKALTAEGRISAIVLMCLPPGLGVVMYIMNQSYMEPLFQETLGLIMLGIALLGMVIGFWWMWKVIQIDV